jgi:hypothetical protein
LSGYKAGGASPNEKKVSRMIGQTYYFKNFSILHFNDFVTGNNVNPVFKSGPNHMTAGETAKCRQECSPGTETEAGQGFL